MNTSDKEIPRGKIVEEEVLPIVEERVRLEKRVREGRTVTVRTRPIHETVVLSEPVVKERVTIERVPVGQVIDEVPQVREDGDLTVIPVVEERVRVVVELVLTEEIHMRRTREETVSTHEVERRRTEIDIGD